MLTVMFACVLCASRRPLSALTLPAMLIAYNLATSMALSSPTDYRFFLSTPMLAPLCLLGLFAQPACWTADDSLKKHPALKATLSPHVKG